MTDSERLASFVKGDELEILRILKIHNIPNKRIQERLHLMQEHSCQYAIAMVDEGRNTVEENKKYNSLLNKNDALLKYNEKLKKEINYLKQTNKKLNKMVAYYDRTIGKDRA